eukprot:4285372-Pyramimonas_sp.AAC.1
MPSGTAPCRRCPGTPQGRWGEALQPPSVASPCMRWGGIPRGDECSGSAAGSLYGTQGKRRPPRRTSSLRS